MNIGVGIEFFIIWVIDGKRSGASYTTFGNDTWGNKGEDLPLKLG